MVHGPAKQNGFPQSAGHGWNRDDRAGVLKRRAHIGKTAIGSGRLQRCRIGKTQLRLETLCKALPP
jgi:hypothetical protein